MSLSLDDIFAEATRAGQYVSFGAASDFPGGGLAQVAVPVPDQPIDATLFSLGRSAAALLASRPSVELVQAFAGDYLQALHAAQLSFSDVARGNLRKARGAFIPPNAIDLPTFDLMFDPEEQLPEEFRIRINQRGTGRSYLQWNGVFIGDPLTDNIGDPDGYRFHDVFHFAHAAILHWSPVMRALIKQKRKSKKEYDEAQDGGRAIVVEEGLTAWIFSYAKELNFFDGQKRVSLGVLKTIQQFVSGCSSIEGDRRRVGARQVGQLNPQGAVFLSAGVPDPGAQHFMGEGDTAAISAAVSALLYVTLGRRRLVWGGQPAITPMIWAFAEAIGVDYGAWITLYQSRIFEDEFPEETMHFKNVIFTDAMIEGQSASLAHMRDRMITETAFSAAVFIGGMAGIIEEFELFKSKAPEAVILPVVSTGGAAQQLGKMFKHDEGLDNNLDYIDLFYRTLEVDPNERRYRNLAEQPQELAQRIVVPGE